MSETFDVCNWLYDAGMDEMANCQLPSPDLLDYYNNLKNRILVINEDITDYVIKYAMQILQWNKEDIGCDNPQPIKIFINSDGGDLSAILCLIDVIEISKTPVYTYGLGKCYSSGGMLLMAGHKRFIFPNTTYLLHDGYTSYLSGSTGKVTDSLRFTESQEKRVKQYILKHSNISEKQYDDKYRNDWFMFSDDIIANNIADVIVSDITEVI